MLHLLLCLCFVPGQLSFLHVFFFFFPTDSNPDRSTDSQGGPSGLPQAMARAHPHSARVCEGSGWPAAAQSAVNLLSCHQNSSIQTTGAGQTAFSGCKSTILAASVLIQNSITTFCSPLLLILILIHLKCFFSCVLLFIYQLYIPE